MYYIVVFMLTNITVSLKVPLHLANKKKMHLLDSGFFVLTANFNGIYQFMKQN